MTHKDLRVWKEAIGLVKEVYEIATTFPKDEIYGLVSQIKRSAVSIPSNIAEGAARNSQKELVQFLFISLGSLSELETQLIISQELGFMNKSEVFEKIEHIRRMLLNMIKSLRSKK